MSSHGRSQILTLGILGSMSAAMVALWKLRQREKRMNNELEQQKEELERQKELTRELENRSVVTLVDELNLGALNDAALSALGETLTKKASAVTAEVTKRILVADEKNQAACVVCQDMDKTHTFLPCGHRCACATCASQILRITKQCPLCRSSTSGAVQVYV